MREPRKELEEASKGFNEFIDSKPVDPKKLKPGISMEKFRMAHERFHKALDHVYKLIDERYSN